MYVAKKKKKKSSWKLKKHCRLNVDKAESFDESCIGSKNNNVAYSSGGISIVKRHSNFKNDFLENSYCSDKLPLFI